MSDGRIEFEITADGKQAIQQVRQVTESITQEAKKWDQATDSAFDQVGQNAQEATKAIEKETKSWGQSAEKAANDIEGNFANVAKNIAASLSAAAIGKAILNFGKEAIDAASNLSEVQNVVDVTFGSGASKIETWAKNAGRQFGLTETQAKKFTSTLGAMMKSAGMSGDGIVKMSTDLAGLAADMASFYNLDFETAFEKIRSGISGETEPLKQLGINMSVANLEAFALEKGITKAFNSMSQQEQTMLRYQYFMKATADAQGDFARTSDGFANASRRVETAWESIKTKIGTALLPGVEDALGQIAKVMEALTQEPEETLFDKVKAIDIDAQGKLADIQAVADAASGLIAQLGFIAETDTKDAIASLASGANSLKASAPGTWQAFFGSLKNIDGLQNLFGEGSKADENIRNLVSALTSNTFDDTKANAWKTLLDSFGENAEGLTKLTGKSAEETKKWLEGIADAVNSIDPTNADAWDKMLTTLVSGFATDTPEGQQFISGLAESFLAMGSDSDAAIKGLQALGYSSEQIASKQAEWLKTVQQLKETIPGLSSVVDEETGAITGGYGALQKYVSEWKATQDKLIYWKAYYAKREALAETQGQLDSMYVEAGGAQWAVDNYLKNHPEINRLYKSGGTQAVQREGGKEGREFYELWNNATEAQTKYQTALAQTSEETQKLANEEQFLTENYALTEEELEQYTGELNNAGDAAGEFGGKSVESWTEVTQNVYDSIKALNDYVKTVRDATSQAVSSVVNGFNQVQRPGEQAALKIEELQKKLQEVGETSKEGLKIKAQIDELQASVNEFSPEKITTNLQSQLSFMEHYMENLEFMRGKVSDEFLASLSDGSKESAEYLSQMVSALQGSNAKEAEEQVAEADRLFQEVQAKKESFIDTLTQQKLAVDETYDALVQKAKEAVAEMDLSGEAGQNATATVSAIAEGLAGGVSEVSAAVSAILAELGRLAKFKIDTSFGGFGGLKLNGSFATGLDYVPFNGFLAELHEGEGILTAEENRLWQRFKNGGESGRNAIDMDALGGVMRDNINPGGNVYLDGRIVGAVVSKAQGESYRALQRSGWQG
jgi:hypothetical protein